MPFSFYLLDALIVDAIHPKFKYQNLLNHQSPSMYPSSTHALIINAIAKKITHQAQPQQFYAYLHNIHTHLSNPTTTSSNAQGLPQGDSQVRQLLTKIISNKQDGQFIGQLSKYSITLAETITFSRIIREEKLLEAIYLTIAQMFMHLERRGVLDFAEESLQKQQYFEMAKALMENIRQFKEIKGNVRNQSSNYSSQSQSKEGQKTVRSLLTQKIKQAQFDELQSQFFISRIILQNRSQNKSQNKENLNTREYSTNEKEFHHTPEERFILSENLIDNHARPLQRQRKESHQSIASEMGVYLQRKREKRERVNEVLGCSECAIY